MRKYISFLLICAMLITGCGKETKYPELITPESTLDLYYTVQRGEIKNESVFNGTIAPRTETLFFETYGDVFQVNYRLGDEVKTGDVIFSLNENIDSQIESLEAEIANHEIITGYYESDYNSEVAALNRDLESLSGLEQELLSIEIEELGIEYKKITTDRNNIYTQLVNKYNDLLVSKENSVITAPCDGRIVYLGVSEEGDFASKNTVACVIADENQKVVQFENLDESLLYTLRNISVQVAGVEYDNVSFIKYTDEELLYCDANYIPLYSRLIVENLPQSTAFGTYCAVFLSSEVKENVLYVPNDSIFINTQNNEKYCLLLQEDGTQKRVNVTTGLKNSIFTEISAGLEEGDKVFYTRDASVWTGDTETAKAYTGNYSHYINFPYSDYPGVYIDKKGNTELRADLPCIISEILLERTTNIYVEEGTPLFSVSANIDEASYDALEYQYEALEETKSSQIVFYDSLISDKQQEILSSTGNAVKAAAELEIEKLEKEKQQKVAEIQSDIDEVADSIKLYDECKDGKEIIITAPVSGIFNTESTLVEGKGLSLGTLIGYISDIKSCIPYVSDHMKVLKNGNVVELDGFLKYGNKVTIFSRNNDDLVEIAATVVTAKNVLPKNISADVSIKPDDINQITDINTQNTYVRVRDIEVSNVLLLDSDFIYSDERGVYVLLQYGDSAIVRHITIATPVIGDDETVWVTSGLQDGDICIKR